MKLIRTIYFPNKKDGFNKYEVIAEGDIAPPDYVLVYINKPVEGIGNVLVQHDVIDLKKAYENSIKPYEMKPARDIFFATDICKKYNSSL